MTATPSATLGDVDCYVHQFDGASTNRYLAEALFNTPRSSPA